MTSYLIERCQGAACTPSRRSATSRPAVHADTGLTAITTYRYRVRATDAASNLSAYSNRASDDHGGAGHAGADGAQQADGDDRVGTQINLTLDGVDGQRGRDELPESSGVRAAAARISRRLAPRRATTLQQHGPDRVRRAIAIASATDAASESELLFEYREGATTSGAGHAGADGADG